MTVPGPVVPDVERDLAARLRVVATDIDGTIVRHPDAVSPRTLAAFRACAEAGIRVVFVTGRPPRWLVPVAEEAGLAGQAVCANGAVVYDLTGREVLCLHALAPAAVLEVADRLRGVLPGVAVAVTTTRKYALAVRFTCTVPEPLVVVVVQDSAVPPSVTQTSAGLPAHAWPPAVIMKVVLTVVP